MVQLDAEFPAYGFAENKGYGSQRHMDALAACGATLWHRRSFEPVKSMQLEPLPYGGHETLILKKAPAAETVVKAEPAANSKVVIKPDA